MEIFWSPDALRTYQDEIDFIFNKWNSEEVDKFISLVDETISVLKTDTAQGIYSRNRDTYRWVISKQTTLYYKRNTLNSSIELVLFWNNQKDPKTLKAILTNL